MSESDKAITGAAADTALELMKQLITLSSGIVALSATFIEKFPWYGWWHLTILLLSWVSLILAVLMGLETISAIVKTRLQPDEHDWSRGRGLYTARVSKYGFVAGLGLFALFAFVALSVSSEGTRKSAPRQAHEIEVGAPGKEQSERELSNKSLEPMQRLTR